MKYVKLFLLVAVALFAISSATYAEPAAYEEHIEMEFNSSKYVYMNQKILRIFVGNGDIIKVHQPSSNTNEFIVTSGDEAASTTVFIWTEDGARHEYLVSVSEEQYGQAKIIEDAIGLPNVHVQKVAKKILLKGKVKNQYERNYAIQTARLYVEGSGKNNLSVGSNVNMTLQTQSADNASTSNIQLNTLEDSGNIIDLLEMESPTQIYLEAQVVEINTEKAKDLGVQYGVSNTGGIFYFGENYERSKTVTVYDRYLDNDGRLAQNSISYPARNKPFRENPLRWIEEHFSPINAQINALVNDGKARILSRPNVITMSGEQATIHIGGEIPYQTTDSNGSTNTEFKDYGIILQFKPVLDSQNRITAAVHTEVSSIDGQTPDGEQYTFSKRFADSVVTVNSGSTMVVGGLMDSSESKNINKIPLLGDIPILGEFFKYTSKSRDKRELMILITPRIVEIEDTSNAKISDEMRDLYYEGQREHNNLNDIDVNALPPPFPEKDDDNKKGKKSSKDKKSKNQNYRNREVIIEDYQPEKSVDEYSNEDLNEDSNEDFYVEVFDDGF